MTTFALYRSYAGMYSDGSATLMMVQVATDFIDALVKLGKEHVGPESVKDLEWDYDHREPDDDMVDPRTPEFWLWYWKGEQEECFVDLFELKWNIEKGKGEWVQVRFDLWVFEEGILVWKGPTAPS